MALSTGRSFAPASLWINSYSNGADGWTDYDTYPRTLGDVDATGRADIVGFGNAGAYVTHYDHQARMVYDADGNRVVSVIDGERAVYIGDWVETGAAYYHLGGQRVAKRATGGVTYLHGDHLGSTAKTTGAASSGQLYEAYGAKRGASEVDTPYRYTGQRWEENDALDIYYYKARWYDPALGRFLQPDPIIPQAGNPQSLNRYAYVLNNPVRFSDPTGHYTYEETPNDPWIYSDSQVRSAYYWTHPEYSDSGTPDDFTLIATATSPFWVPVVGVAAVAAAEAAIIGASAASAAVKTAVSTIISAISADGDPTNEARQVGTWANESVSEGSRFVQRWGPHTGSGPLGETVAQTFRSSSYSEVVLTQETSFYRVYGGVAPEVSRYWSRVIPTGPLQSQIDLALLPEWGNTASQVARINVPAGTTVFEGVAAPAQSSMTHLLGGGSQVVIPYVDPN